MSYDNTVRCGWCHESGHNKRSCPAFKEQIETWAQSDDPYYQRRAEAAKSRQKGRAKRCSYCGETSHTIRKCDLHNERVDTEAHLWLDARKFIETNAHQHNFGVGSLVRVTGRQWRDGNYHSISWLGLVLDIKYDQITHRDLSDSAFFYGQSPMTVQWIGGDQDGRRDSCRLPSCIIDRGQPEDTESRGRIAYDKHISKTVLVSGSQAFIPSEIFDWKVVRKAVYQYFKRG